MHRPRGLRVYMGMTTKTPPDETGATADWAELRRRLRAFVAGRVSGGASTHGLRSGQGVFHNKFGEGVIVTIEGSGEDARAQVNFGRHGMKWLALSVAKLTPVD